ncbi:MAG: hypothetical protein DCF22_00445 [Leptolyngbya sp.]|nr:MAG: hypothetical protein DCF22_00445 [Leptolyngbya sp.]
MRSLYGVPSTWFDSDGYFCLPILPDNAEINDTFLGEVGMTPTFTRLYYQGARRVIRGYTFTIPDGKTGLYYLIEHLASLSAGNPYTPLLIKDWVRPERADYAAGIAASTEPLTPRQGVLLEPKLIKGLIGINPTYAYAGFTFRFQEQIARAV